MEQTNVLVQVKQTAIRFRKEKLNLDIAPRVNYDAFTMKGIIYFVSIYSESAKRMMNFPFNSNEIFIVKTVNESEVDHE